MEIRVTKHIQIQSVAQYTATAAHLVRKMIFFIKKPEIPRDNHSFSDAYLEYLLYTIRVDESH